MPAGRVYDFERLPEGLEGGNNLFVRNFEIPQVVGQPADKKEEHVRADIYCGSELPDYVSTRRSAKIVFDLVQVGLGNRVTILKSDARGELALREAERLPSLPDQCAESSHAVTDLCSGVKLEFYIFII